MIRAIIAAFALFANATVFASSMQYAIMIDAGSTGSRLHLFQYTQTDNLPVIEDIFSAEVKPGLSSYANPADAAQSLNKLFADANAQLTAKQIDQHDVSVYVLATAGMRLLAPEKANEIYQAIRISLQDHYTFTIGDIATIPEKMEGVYGWLDVNYLANNFDGTTDKTVGIIDMGGASTEIAFSTRDNTRTDDEITFTINGITYTVFSKNFIGLGQDQSRSAMNANAQANACYPVNYTLTPTSNGLFNLATCSAFYADIINEHRVAEQLLPISSQQRFIGYSGVYHDFHFLDADNLPTQANVEQRIQTVCAQSWEQLKTNYANVSEKYLANYCANSVFVAKLLFGTYQLQQDQLEVKNKIDGKNIDWTLGALLYRLI